MVEKQRNSWLFFFLLFIPQFFLFLVEHLFVIRESWKEVRMMKPTFTSETKDEKKTNQTRVFEDCRERSLAVDLRLPSFKKKHWNLLSYYL